MLCKKLQCFSPKDGEIFSSEILVSAYRSTRITTQKISINIGIIFPTIILVLGQTLKLFRAECRQII